MTWSDRPGNGASRPSRVAPPMVGRRKELDALQLALQGALRGAGSVVLIGGEPGIGKSRLVRELMLAAKDTFAVHTGDCFEGELAMPYRPWLEVLRSMGGTSAGNASSASNISHLIPSFVDTPSVLTEDDDDDLDRLRLFDSVLAFIKGAAESRPVMLVLEDLHWADRSTIGLLRHVARRAPRLPLVIVVTYRTTEVDEHHPLHDVAVEVRERRLGTLLELQGLSLAEATELLGASANTIGGLSPDQVAALRGRTDGNPYFLEEILRHLQETSPGTLAADVVGIPRGILEVITQRLGKRSPECVEALRAAAILGRTFSLDLLSDLASMDEPRLGGALREAMSAHLVEELATTPAQCRFVHALVQDALLGKLAPGEAQSLHLKAAEAIERRSAGEPDAAAAVLARHYRLAQSPRALRRLIATTIDAIRIAADASALDEARETFEVTLTEIEALGATELERALFIAAIIRGPFQRLAPRGDWLVQVAEPAAEVLFDNGRNELGAVLLAAVFWALVVDDSFEALDPLKALEILDRIRQVTRDEFLLAQCDGNLPMLLMLLGRLEEMRSAAETLLESPYPAARAGAQIYLADWFVYNGWPMRGRERFETGWQQTTVISPAEAPVIITVGSMACAWASGAWWRLRAPLQQGILLEKELALQRQPARLRRQLQAFLAHAHKDRGVAAESSSDLRAREPNAEAWTAMTLSWLDFREGSWGAAIKSMRAALGQIRPEVLEDTAMISELVVEASRHVDPVDAAEFVPEWQFGSHVPLWSVIAHALAGLIAAEIGDFEAVCEHAQAARGRMTDDDWLGLGARVELIEAIAALSERDEAESQSRFDSAIATMRRVEHPWDESDAHCILGKVLVRLGRPQEATAHFDEALAILTRIEAARPFVDRVLAGRRETGAPDPKPSARAGATKGHGAGELSEREIEVLRLLSRGLSNRQIAAELVISEPTVATHVRHILDKTGSANRAEAAAFAVRNGLDRTADHPI